MCFSTRVDEKRFVLNSFINVEWGKEAKENINIKQGEDIDIRIRAHEDAWEIWAQGKQVATFDFRMPLTAINHIYIVGEVELNRCAWEGRYYPMPFQTALPSQAIAPGKSIYIAGACEKKCEKFEIDIKSGNDFILHMNPRFKDKKIIRNSCRGGVWDDVEEADGPDFPFTKDHSFDVMISCEPDLYRIYVNGEEFCTYRHRLAPDSADNLCIDGDITIQGIHW